MRRIYEAASKEKEVDHMYSRLKSMSALVLALLLALAGASVLQHPCKAAALRYAVSHDQVLATERPDVPGYLAVTAERRLIR
jgi:hypothetical protein